MNIILLIEIIVVLGLEMWYNGENLFSAEELSV